jgi:hypothetical protein
MAKSGGAEQPVGENYKDDVTAPAPEDQHKKRREWADEEPLDDPLYSQTEFRLYCFKV